MKIAHVYVEDTFEGCIAQQFVDADQHNLRCGLGLNNRESLLWEGYAGSVAYHDWVRKTIKSVNATLAKEDPDQVVIHCGEDLLSLYIAANFVYLNLPYNLFMHRAPVIGGVSAYLSIHAMLRRRLAMTALNGCTKMIVPSNAGAKAIEKMFPRAHPFVATLPSPILPVETASELQADKISIIANFEENQGIEEALFCAINAKPKKIQVVGSGSSEYRDRLLGIVSDANVEGIVFDLELTPPNVALDGTCIDGETVVLAQLPNDNGLTRHLNLAMQLGGTLLARREYAEYLDEGALLYQAGNTAFLSRVLTDLVQEPSKFIGIRSTLAMRRDQLAAIGIDDLLHALLSGELDG